MVIQDFMAPDELIKYTCPNLITHANQSFNLHITNDKLILHNTRGFIFKKDDIIAHRLEEITTMKYQEKGIINKRGILDIHTKDKKLPLEGSPASMKAVWQELQKYINTSFE